MRVVISAGGTQEKIDKVRSITNFSSGKLASIIADQYLALDECIDVVYVCTKDAILPTNPNYTKFEVTSVDELMSTLNMLISYTSVDIVVHAMAVSDYTINKITTLDSIIDNVHTNDTSKSVLERLDDLSKHDKISSSLDDLTIVLKRTPKVIANIKQWDPRLILVGFKLLDSVSNDELLQVAQQLLVKNQCDFVLANDFSLIDDKQHQGWLIDKDDRVDHAMTKRDIAKLIVERTHCQFKGVKI